jgi:serine protease Do
VAATEPDRESAYTQLAADAAEMEKASRIMRTAAELTFPSVVHIEATMTRLRTTHNTASEGIRQATSRQIEETGTGFIVAIDDHFWVVTNRHVIGAAELGGIRLLLHDRRQLTPKRVLINTDFDIAVIEIVEKEVIRARLGDSSTVQQADKVIVIGSPYGLSGSITSGIISAVGRRNIPKGDQPIPLQDMLQTDAPINPGNSGGPLINMRGEVIGVISAIASSSGANEGVGFAIPINDAMRVAENLVRYGEMQRPYLGVELSRNLTDRERRNIGTSRQIGVKITAVTPDSPAAVAGLHVGDIILKYNGGEVEDDNHFVSLVAHDTIGSQPRLTVLRFRDTLTITPQLAAQKSL